ncbi:MAG: hypothetical protein DMF68_19930 [Acidobacteria bacterium]|nr:MAG: hypothetical protein DMF68_19930 [Acidobacteriota bacterium]
MLLCESGSLGRLSIAIVIGSGRNLRMERKCLPAFREQHGGSLTATDYNTRRAIASSETGRVKEKNPKGLQIRH